MGNFQREKNTIRNTKKEWKNVGRAFLILCVISFVFAFILWKDGIFYFDKETQSVDAIVIKTTWSPERHNNSYHAVQYTYTFNQQEFIGVEKMAFNKYIFAEGDTILVQVLKRKPAISNITLKD